MVFKISCDDEENITTFKVEAMGNKQINITITGKDGKERIIAIYEHGAVYISGTEVGNWKE
jgi:predicted  nucleic acid-binding Zn-ribbon protein